MSTPGALHSRQSDEWWTPDEVFLPLHKEFNFGLDVCASSEEASRIPEEGWYLGPDVEEGYRDGLTCQWHHFVGEGFTHEPMAAWCNPPYSTVAQWIAKAWTECWHHGVTTVMLINNITETEAWSRFVMGDNASGACAAEVRFVKGRVYFVAGCDMVNAEGEVTLRKGETGPAPKGSVIVVFRPGHVGPPKFSMFHQDAGLIAARKERERKARALVKANEVREKRGWEPHPDTPPDMRFQITYVNARGEPCEYSPGPDSTQETSK